MITLYHVPGARSTRSLWLLNELGVEFELDEMAFDLKVLRAPEYLIRWAGFPVWLTMGRRFLSRARSRSIYAKNTTMAGLAVVPVIRSGMNGCSGYTTPKPSPFMVPAWSSSRSLFPKNNVHLLFRNWNRVGWKRQLRCWTTTSKIGTTCSPVDFPPPM